MRISDWSSDVCSSDLGRAVGNKIPVQSCLQFEIRQSLVADGIAENHIDRMSQKAFVIDGALIKPAVHQRPLVKPHGDKINRYFGTEAVVLRPIYQIGRAHV